MKIKTAIILCAGFGKRLMPLTEKTPKPLLKINEISLLENTINLIKIQRLQREQMYYLKRKNILMIQTYWKKRNYQKLIMF